MIWLGKWAADEIERWRTAATENAVRFASEIGENIRLKEENARLRSDLDWFKLAFAASIGLVGNRRTPNRGRRVLIAVAIHVIKDLADNV